jgi:hypothetical protein
LLNDRLLLLLKGLDQLAPGRDVTSYQPIGVVNETDNGGLFDPIWERKSVHSQFVTCQMCNRAFVTIIEGACR